MHTTGVLIPQSGGAKLAFFPNAFPKLYRDLNIVLNQVAMIIYKFLFYLFILFLDRSLAASHPTIKLYKIYLSLDILLKLV